MKIEPRYFLGFLVAVLFVALGWTAALRANPQQSTQTDSSTDNATSTSAVVTQDATSTPAAFATPDHPGSLHVSSIGGPEEYHIARYGDNDVVLGIFNVSADDHEDINLRGITVELYSGVYGNELTFPGVSHLRMVDNDTRVVYAQVPAVTDECYAVNATQDQCTAAYHYVRFVGNTTIPKGATRRFVILGDISSAWRFNQPDLNIVLPSWTSASGRFSEGISSRFEATGVTSGVSPRVTGEASSGIYMEWGEDPGLLAVYGDGSFFGELPPINQAATISHFYVRASNTSDVDLSFVAPHVSNFIRGQYTNLRLVADDGVQFGDTVAAPAVREDISFNADRIIHAGEVVGFRLIADTNIKAENQYEVDIYGMERDTSGDSIVGTLPQGEQYVPVSGGFSQQLYFEGKSTTGYGIFHHGLIPH